MDPIDLIYLKGKGTSDLTREKGKITGSKRGKGKGMEINFDIHADLTYSCACMHERNETISRLVSAPEPPIYIYIYYIPRAHNLHIICYVGHYTT